jgi:protein O-GlcNAc transferase
MTARPADAKDAAAWLAHAQRCAHREDWPEAEHAYRHLHGLLPAHAAILRNWLRALEQLGRIDAALTQAALWLQTQSNDLAMWQRVVTLAQTGQRMDVEVHALQRLGALAPDVPQHACALGRAQLSANRIDDARHTQSAALARWPTYLPLLWQQAVLLDPIPRDTAHIAEDRATRAAALTVLEHYQGPFDDAIEAVSRSSFYFAYHGMNEREPASRFAAQVLRHTQRAGAHIDVDLSRAPLNGRRLRIVFASAHWHNHTIGRYFGCWVERFDRTRFEVALAHDGTKRDAVTERLESCADAVLRPSSAQSFAQALAAWRADVIVYPDVGMVAKHMPLFAQRLAPLQLAAWGHPVSTGFAGIIDAYISVAAMEPSDAASHYAEPALITLPGIGVLFTPKPVPAPSSRAALGLPLTGPLLICLQSLFKIHPDDDALFVRTLLAMPDAHLILFCLKDAHASTRYRERLTRTMTEHGIADDRLIMLPQMAHAQFLQVMMACTVVLDTHHFSGGNTSLDALACGMSIVTWPGLFMRGRQTAGMLTLMGENDAIAQSADAYCAAVMHAVQHDTQDARAARRARAAVLFNDHAAIDALSDAIYDMAISQRTIEQLASHASPSVF